MDDTTPAATPPEQPAAAPVTAAPAADPAATGRTLRRPAAGGGGGGLRINWVYALASLVVGALLWFGVDLKRMEDVTLDVGVQLRRQLPADWRFTVPPAGTVRVTLRGASQDVASLRGEELSLEPEYPPGALDGDVYDGMLTLQSSQVRDLPPGVEVVAVAPQVIPIHLSKIITRYINVEAGEITGTPQEGYAVGGVRQLDPMAMPVSASREFLSKITSSDVIRTAPFNVDGGRGLVGGMVALLPLEKDGETVDIPGMVYMTVELEEIPAERRIEQPYEVRALLDSPFDRYAHLNLSPPAVTVTVAGPQSVIDKLSPGEIAIYADLRDRIPAAPGEFNIKCKAITPARVRVTRIEPDTVKWITRDDDPQPASASAPATRE